MTPRHPSAGAPALHATDGATTDGTCGVIGANRTYEGANEGSPGLVGTLFFSDYLGMTSQVIRSYGAHDEGAWDVLLRALLRLPDRTFPRPLHARRERTSGRT